MRRHSSGYGENSCKGFSLMELLVSMAVLGVLLLMLGQLAVTVLGMQRRGEAERLVAQEAGNLAERLSTLSFDELDDDRVTAWLKEYSPDDAEVSFAVQVTGDDAERGALRSKQISIAATHRHVPHACCNLNLWKHASPEESP
jgi:prepilin-type N-terminal cleavage/methylation domain-containing protein